MPGPVTSSARKLITSTERAEKQKVQDRTEQELKKLSDVYDKRFIKNTNEALNSPNFQEHLAKFAYRSRNLLRAIKARTPKGQFSPLSKEELKQGKKIEREHQLDTLFQEEYKRNLPADIRNEVHNLPIDTAEGISLAKQGKLSPEAARDLLNRKEFLEFSLAVNPKVHQAQEIATDARQEANIADIQHGLSKKGLFDPIQLPALTPKLSET